MELSALLPALFPRGHDVTEREQFVRGSGETALGPVAVLGTAGCAAIDARLALAIGEGVLETVERHPERPIVFLVDTSGQALSRHQEMIGINAYLAHLATCIDLARRSGHVSVGLVYNEAVSGGFLSFGLMADRAYALAEAQIRVMDLKAMARVTKIVHERLVELAQTSPVFAPGAHNYVRMGAIEAQWPAPSAALLEQAIAELQRDPEAARRDRRMERGLERGGRSFAQPIAAAVAQA